MGDLDQTGYEQLGHLVRQLHGTLKELGCEESMQQIASDLPDTQDRLNYVVQLTEQAAQRVLESVEKALPIQNELEAQASSLSIELKNAKDPASLSGKVQDFLDSIPKFASETSSHLTDILMAQDFQDLTGQVIKKVTRLAQEMEHQLVNILLISREDSRNDEGLMNGPVVKSEGRNDIVTNQVEVDDLLNSLGF